MSCARKVGAANLAAAVRSKNTCKACAFGTGGQRGGLHNEYSNRIEICNKNIQAQLSDIRDPIPREIFEQNSIAELGELSGKQLENLGRLATPLYKKAGEKSYVAISYVDAFEIVSSRMKASDPEKCFFYGSGRSSNEAAFILQLFARLFGSNHVNNCSYYCHQASGVGLVNSIGTGTATIRYGDLHQADCIFVFGANPASNHPRFVKVLLECRQRGGKVVVINPAREAGLVRFASPSNFKSMISGGGDVASHYFQPNVGGDVALISGIAKSLIESGDVNQQFIEHHCLDYEAYENFINTLSWADICRESGLERHQFDELAQLYKDSEKTVFSWGMGLTHHSNGTDNIEAVANLALLRGMIGGAGKGLLPLRGHSNVQGVGSMGFTPKLKTSLFEAIEREYAVSLPTYEGMDTLACVQAAAKNDIDFALLLGGNLFSANPDTAFSSKALDAIPFKVMINSTLNQTHINGVEGENLILPIKVRDEESQPTTQESMFNYVRMSDGGFDRIEGLLSEVDIVSNIASRVVDSECFDFREFSKHKSIRRAISKLVPGFEAMAKLDESKQEFHIDGRHLSKPEFPTRSGRASFRIPENTDWQRKTSSAPHEFTLTSVRSEGQFNTIIYSEEDVYRGQAHRQVLFMNPEDIEEMGFSVEEKIDVSNETGIMRNLELAEYSIRRGNVMCYFPEANVLIPQQLDVRSRTPSFKSVSVQISKSKKKTA
ncbi:MAG: FdhF/YdeP family oxidoreductase [Gammaproteobacteria bacterium]|jgi:molybdopterin-dependent oxidoreductase alpha subunit|nr:FdhF/YdeP family oxidoreductase [Gammaproteobacteria bacterium]MBT3860021.1 FdhF/YdeP family oxidoreductase [Gammaproteobacteria bacterium]MBT3987029.1 FdhF/YdeP family oxidoreductase [Gammaproteobacteria bacterium]MBT4658641.1 FdhF/YdeP family oxidoreductase [Gammaproteobacteria bacterium]MBT4893455.1 FdhF/YdeP family oxidoreductase [Gammaproteobacteria bacterium]